MNAHPTWPRDAAQEKTQEEAPPIVIPLEALLYIAILALAAIFRLAQLGHIPLTDWEAHEALAAWEKIKPAADESATIFPSNPLGALFTMLAFTFLGPLDAVARFPTALAGIALVATPLLYRRWIGATAALLLSLGLAASPLLQIASRQMSGMVWAHVLLMALGYCALHFWQTGERRYSLAGMVLLAGVLLGSTPYGILIVMGLGIGLAWGLWPQWGGEDLRHGLRAAARAWFSGDNLLAALLALGLTATIFFSSPGSLSAIPYLLEVFAQGLLNRADLPFAYPFWLALRYELIFILFALGAIGFSWGEATFLERFLTGWFLWSLLCAIFYPGGNHEIALMLPLPALALTVSFILRLIETAGYGYWQVPWWVIPLHALCFAGLLSSLAAGLISQSRELYLESHQEGFGKVINFGGFGTSEQARIGTFRGGVGNTMLFSLPRVSLVNCRAQIGDRDPNSVQQDTLGRYCDRQELWELSLQVIPLDAASQLGRARLVTGPEGTLIEEKTIGPEGAMFHYTGTAAGDYRLEFSGDPSLDQAQYGVIGLLGKAGEGNLLTRFQNGDILRESPQNYLLLSISLRALRGWAFVLLMMLALLLPMTYFLAGAFYGARAAWRGVLFGVLLFGGVYGLALGWQAAVVYGGDSRELWTVGRAAGSDYRNLEALLIEYSRRATGTNDEVAITAQTANDSALAWVLRRYPHVNYVEHLGPQIASPIVIAPDTTPPPQLGAQYVGQQLQVSPAWELGSLNRFDFGEWLFNRRTRFDPDMAAGAYRIWVERSLYDVEAVPEGPVGD